MLKRTGNLLWLVLVAVSCWLMIDLTLPYLGFETDVDFLLTKQRIIHIRHWRYSFYIHILFSCFALAAGLTQFSQRVLKKYKKLHRVAGYIYVIDILCLAGPSGLIMGFYANGTVWAKMSFMLLAALWILFTTLALQRALIKDFIAHRSWMMRSYALTLSAITLRLFALLLPRWIHLEAFTEYTLIAWLSWTVNLAIAELVIFFRKRSVPVL